MTSTFQEDQVFVSGGHLVLKLDEFTEQPKPKDDDSQERRVEPSDSKKPNQEPNFHVLPAPKDGSLDAAIEMATRATVTMVRT